MALTRRAWLRATSALATGAALARTAPAIATTGDPEPVAVTLRPREATTRIVGPTYPATSVWAYDGSVPGPAIRVPHGVSLEARVENGLDVPTSVHWHGIRLPNAMDGVAGLTQAPIAPGERFDYAFLPPDAGTFWYHSHVTAYEQVGRGLYGPLIVEEAAPPVVDRDLVWMLDDWRLDDGAKITDDFLAGHDLSHAGRIGNVPTVNGRFRDVVRVRGGERLRLRLINAANARHFALDFGALSPTIVAIDGQPTPPHVPDGPITIGVAGRVDVILDMTGEPGSSMHVVDRFYREPFELVRIDHADEPLRDTTLDDSMDLGSPTITVPDIADALEVPITIGGGAMGGLSRAMLGGEWLPLGEIARRGYVWAINDVVGEGYGIDPLIDVPRGRHVKLVIRNETAFPHPMHLHGHHMKLLTIDGDAPSTPRYVDSPLVMPNTVVELAFVADNPGDWLFHCHTLEHHAAGLGAVVRIV